MSLLNDTQSVLFDLYDVRRTLPDRVKKMPKDNEGTEETIGECLDAAIQFLETLEQECMEGACHD
jgi:hypothetical protein